MNVFRPINFIVPPMHPRSSSQFCSVDMQLLSSCCPVYHWTTTGQQQDNSRTTIGVNPKLSLRYIGDKIAVYSRRIWMEQEWKWQASLVVIICVFLFTIIIRDSCYEIPRLLKNVNKGEINIKECKEKNKKTITLPVARLKK